VRFPRAAIAFAALIFLVVLVLPGPTDLAPGAQATHEGDIMCPSTPVPVHDGFLQPGEYRESFFDPKTKVLLYFNCVQDANRTFHVGLATPWDEWTDLRFQATDVWNGDFNVVRVSMKGESAEALDGFMWGAGPNFAEDISVGGSHDIAGLVGRLSSDYYVYEFAFPLLSSDAYDSQLTINGSFYFQLAYATEMATFLESDAHFIQIGQVPSGSRWTSLDLSLPQGNVALEAAEILVGLRDDRFRPMAFMPISVFVRTTFGFLDLGTVLTNEDGLASVPYAPRDEGAYIVGAAFEGERGYLASASWRSLVLTPVPASPTLLPRDLLVIQTLIVLVVGSVWATYAYSLFIVWQGLRASREASSERQASKDENA